MVKTVSFCLHRNSQKTLVNELFESDTKLHSQSTRFILKCMLSVALIDTSSFVCTSLYIFGIGCVAISVSVFRDKIADTDQKAVENFAQTALLLLAWIAFWCVLWRKQYISREYEALGHKSIVDLCTLMSGLAFGTIMGITSVLMLYFDVMLNVVFWILLCTAAILATILLVVCNLRKKCNLIENDNNQNDDSAYDKLSNWHFKAAWFHMLLILFTFGIGVVKSGINDFSDFVDDWLLVMKPSYLMIPDYYVWDSISKNDTLKHAYRLNTYNQTEINYCAAKKTFPVSFVLASVLWSLASATQHIISYMLLQQQAQLFTIGQLLSKIATWYAPNQTSNYCFYKQVVFTLVVCTLMILCVLFALQWDMFALILMSVWTIGLLLTLIAQHFIAHTSLSTKVEFEKAIAISEESSDEDQEYASTVMNDSSATANNYQQKFVKRRLVNITRKGKWQEYIFSASLMHFVLLYFSGIRSVHEIVSTTILFGSSMYFALISDKALIKAECKLVRNAGLSGTGFVLDLNTQCDMEMPFIALSFLAKGILDFALTLPALRVSTENENEMQIIPTKCVYNEQQASNMYQ